MSKRKNYSAVWDYFTQFDIENKVAVCKICSKHLSYRTTSNNLKSHLKGKHPYRYTQLMSYSHTNGLLKIKQEADDSDESDHVSSEIWNYFEQETGGRVRCVVCRASKSNNVEDLKRHLEENHPKLLQVVGISQDNTGSDQGSVKEDDGTYTEVIYLEDDLKKSTTKPKYIYKTDENVKTIKRTSDMNPKRIDIMADKKRRESSSSEESPLRRNAESNELDTFMTYIKCLLKQLPKDTCAKLQMEIVNLIMNVKLNKTNDSSLDIANISLKVPVISNYATVTENVLNRSQPQSNSAVTDANNHSYVYTEANTSAKNHSMIDDS